MSVSFFPYPLQIGALEEFCHPRDSHLFTRPAYYDGQALAGNGYILLRVHRGLWMPSDFEEPSSAFLSRFLAAPWGEPAADSAEWRSLDSIKASLYRFGAKGMWLRGKCAPSPVWRVGSAFLARLSHLQMIGRLPRCEIIPPSGREYDPDPMHFRFSGGVGMLAHDPKLKESSFSVFAPRYCDQGRHRIEPARPLLPIPPSKFERLHNPPPETGFPDWPPVEAE